MSCNGLLTPPPPPYPPTPTNGLKAFLLLCNDMNFFNEHFINITKTLELNSSVLLLQVFQKLLKLVKIIPALTRIFLCEERSVSSSLLKGCVDSCVSIVTKIPKRH